MDTRTTPDPRRWWALALLCGAFFMVILDAAIVTVALPSIQRDLGFSAAEPAVGRERLRAHVRRPAPARRARGRPARPPARVHGRRSSSSPSPRFSAGSRGRRPR